MKNRKSLEKAITAIKKRIIKAQAAIAKSERELSNATARECMVSLDERMAALQLELNAYALVLRESDYAPVRKSIEMLRKKALVISEKIKKVQKGPSEEAMKEYLGQQRKLLAILCEELDRNSVALADLKQKELNEKRWNKQNDLHVKTVRKHKHFVTGKNDDPKLTVAYNKMLNIQNSVLPALSPVPTR